MKLDLEINNITQSPVADSFFETVGKETFKWLEYDFLNDKIVSVSVALVEPEEIRKLNKEYRKHDSATDILSFPEYGSAKEIKADQSQEIFLGELVLCYNDIKEYADNEDMDLEKELANVFAHGILHLLGFEHSEKMFEIQKEVANAIKE